jgi:hypothetical protein
MRKILFNLYLDSKDFDFITQKAEETGRSKSAIVRGLVMQYRTRCAIQKRREGEKEGIMYENENTTN